MRMEKTAYGKYRGRHSNAWTEVNSVTCWEGDDGMTECRITHGVRDGGQGHLEEETVEVYGMRSNRYAGSEGVNVRDFHFRDGEMGVLPEGDMACYVDDEGYLECGKTTDIKSFAGNF